jgi:hypothetical protein
MSEKERNQNPVIGDLLNLRLFTYNSNHRQPVDSVEMVEIYYLDPTSVTEDNPEGLNPVLKVDGSDVEEVADDFGGHYKIQALLDESLYVIGNYIDVWHIKFNENQSGTVTNSFRILSNLWYASDMPIVYDFSYGFRPNRIRKGERRWLTVNIIPNVPSASDLEKYYTNLSVASPVKIFIEKRCGECVPAEKDLRMVVERGEVQYRRDSEGYFFLDTDNLGMECGIYDVWFELEFGESKYLSDSLQLQIY